MCVTLGPLGSRQKGGSKAWGFHQGTGPQEKMGRCWAGQGGHLAPVQDEPGSRRGAWHTVRSARPRGILSQSHSSEESRASQEQACLGVPGHAQLLGRSSLRQQGLGGLVQERSGAVGQGSRAARRRGLQKKVCSCGHHSSSAESSSISAICPLGRRGLGSGKTH